MGGGHKRLYRKVDFKRDKLGISAIVYSVEYDPNRNARIALLHYKDGEKRYILHPVSLNVGDVVISDFEASIKVGNALSLNRIPLGTEVHNVEFRVWAGDFIGFKRGLNSLIIELIFHLVYLCKFCIKVL